MIIHYCDYASQPDIRIFCDQSWTRPAWNDASTSIENVYKTEDNRVYTFNLLLTTCLDCAKKADKRIEDFREP